jgi:hypothetical protein
MPLNLEYDLPKFYLNPFGVLESWIRGRKYLLDGPLFIREVEVKYPLPIYPSEIYAVVIHADEKKIEEDCKNRLEEIKPGSDWEKELKEHYKYYAEDAKNFIARLRKRYKILPEVPVTEFRKMAREVTRKVFEYYEEHRIRSIEDFDIIEEMSRRLHKAIAYAYKLDYDRIVEDTRSYVEVKLKQGWRD